MRPTIAALALVACAATPAQAQDQREVNSLAQECIDALDSGDLAKATTIATTFAELRNRTVAQPARQQASECLSQVSGKTWVFDTSSLSFIPLSLQQAQREMDRILLDMSRKQVDAHKEIREILQEAAEQDAATELLLAEAEEAYQSALESRVNAQTLIACNALYARDEHAALLSSVCHPLFVVNGLPDD